MQPAGAFAGTRATYVAISAVSILILALITSLWVSDVSGTIALLGLLSIYMSSTELLVLFMALAPVSALVDIIRLTGPHVNYNYRGWLVFFSIAEILAKAAGSVFAVSLYRSMTSDCHGTYQPMNPSGGAPAQSVPVNMVPPPPYQASGNLDNPFSYAPPRADAHNGGSNTYQPFPTSTQPHL